MTTVANARPVDWSGIADAANQKAAPPTKPADANAKQSSEVREAFDQFVGQTFFGQLMKSMRQSVGKPAYFHGGRGEEIFQAQMDQVLTERMTEATANTFSGPMFELFTLQRH